MTPLEMAKAYQKSRPCCSCPNGERVGKTLFCKKTGRIILTAFETIQCCHGRYMEGNDYDDTEEA